MKHPFLFLASSLLLTGTAHAQATFSFGPRVGITHSSVHGDIQNMMGRTGVEAGLVGVLQVGHFAFQPAVLYAQRGFTRQETALGSPTQRVTNTRLDYLSIPLNLAYTQHANGQGFQLFAGPYLGFLLGGRNELTYSSSQTTGRVVPTNTHTTIINSFALQVPDYNVYARHLDVGAQAGLGYRLGGAVLQLSYCLGLRDVGAAQQYTLGGKTYESDTPNYRNHSWQASLSYLLGS
ncbi:MAG: PorT family protein [Hymenobacter sp.]|nr:MAG: PorT family protein [Hymenobacter sp.]